MSTPGQTDKTQCSLLIMLATPAAELGLFDAARVLRITIDKISNPEFGEYHLLGRIGDEVVIASTPSRREGRVVMGATGRFGTGAKAIHLRRLTGALSIVQLGMAFGINPTRQKLGDVLISSSLIHYDERKVVRDPDKPSGYLVDYSEAREELARPELVHLLREEKQRTHAFGVHIGRMLTGAARIHSESFRTRSSGASAWEANRSWAARWKGQDCLAPRSQMTIPSGVS